MTKSKIQVKDSFIVNALRNCGYNNYSAIADIIDNSLEPEVNSSFVKIDFETDGKGIDKTLIKSILIIDDGEGMDSQTLEEAMTLGSETGKNGTNNLGMYGAGLKTASLSIGQKLEVFTKTEDEDTVNYALISIENNINNGDDIVIDNKTFGPNTEEYSYFTDKVKSKHGTIVKISVLDKLTNKNFQNFKGSLKIKIAEIFNKFIYSKNVIIYVGKDKLEYIDLMGNSINNELMGEGEFTIDGHSISYKAYYIPKDGEENTKNIETNIDGNAYIPRNASRQGLYLYRQNRLVGEGLTLGLWIRDNYLNGFRCEIFFDGNCDSLFGSTFTKMIGETNKDNISQGLKDKLISHINPFKNEVNRRERRRQKIESENNIEEIKKKEDFYKRVTDKQNKNMMLKANRKGENKHKDNTNKEHKTRGPQKNPNPIKERSNKWLDGFEERPLGRTAQMYGMERREGRRIIVINTDHSFYQKIYSKLEDDLKFIMAQYISCEEIAKQQINYYGADDIRNIIDNYNEYFSSEVTKSLDF